MHDVNKSGWFILIPIYNLFLYFTDGTQGTIIRPWSKKTGMGGVLK